MANVRPPISTNLAANGSTSTFQGNARWASGHNEYNTLLAYGTWGGGTLAIEVSFDDSNWVAYTYNGAAVSMTADGAREFIVNAPFVRATLSGATGPDLNVRIM